MSIRWLSVFLDLPAPDLDAAVRFWLQVTEGQLSARRGPDGEFATVLPPQADAYLRVQRVQAGPGGHHLDLHIDPAAESPAAVAARAVALGASRQHVEDDLIVLASPGGFGFCLVPWDGDSVVPGPAWPDPGGANRVDQLSLDIPPDRFDAELRFWRSLTGWDRRSASRPEFTFVEPPPGLPVRLLLQRRDQAGSQDRVTAHLDLACSDIPALTERHVAAGARVLARFPQWTTLADPAGRPYCLTHRDPG
jgi:hypothetical protein